MTIPADIIAEKIKGYLEGLLLCDENFTGQVELHFKNGELMDGYERKKILKQKRKN